MTTYTIVFAAFARRNPGRAENQIIGVARDGDTEEIKKIIDGFRETAGNYRDVLRQLGSEDIEGDDWPIEIQPGLLLTNDEPDDPRRIFWVGDVPGLTVEETYEYAVRT